MLAALEHDGPVIFLEHKLLSETWLEFLGSGARSTVQYDVPVDGGKGAVPEMWEPLPISKAVLRRAGDDVTIVNVGVGVHRALQAADSVEAEGISAAVLDLRTISPLDKKALCEAVAHTGRLLVVDEDYEGFGLSGELGVVALEAGISFKYARVCTQTAIPYARDREDQTLPNVNRIRAAIAQLVEDKR
jgi:pyruvate/2-oxoglutarate/acetoin dehydrogenase E1 component